MNFSNIKRILIIRTDRIGDVVLSTPVITALRKAFPDIYIAMMVSPQTREIITGNPYLNEIIVYDKKLKHKGIFKTLGFITHLKKKKFDLALILHSTTRVNCISFLSGIPKRVGYKKGKMDFLLTEKLEYKKRLGEKHESEYSLDILRSIGLKVESSPPVIVIKKEHEKNIDDLLKSSGLKDGEKFIVLHPGASCISKMWSQENFAKVANSLSRRFNVKVVLVSSPDQVKIGEKVKDLMESKPLFLCGKTSLGELGALFKKASLFISNDSGPVHIACTIGAATISIFGRNEKGLSPTRWKGLSDNNIVLHKDIGCNKCLAHNCKKMFLCLKSITVNEVIEKASELL